MRFDLFFQPLVEVKEFSAIPITLELIERLKLIHIRRQFTLSSIQNGDSIQIVLT